MTTPLQGALDLINDATDINLDTLCDALNYANGICAEGGLKLEHFVDLAGLPTYGGEEPADTVGIYSWDETHFLTYDEGIYFVIERELW